MSLNARLCVFFLGALALVLAGFSTSLYLLARVYLHRQVDDRLEAALAALTATAETEPDGLEWDPSERHLTLGRDDGLEQVRWEVRDGRGRLVDRSANLGSEHLGADAATASGEETPASRLVWHEGRPWQVAQRVLRGPILPPAESRVPLRPGQPVPANRYAALVLTAGVCLEPLHRMLRALALTLTGLSVGLWLAAALLGRWVCRRALAPVTRMATAARDMGATDLDRRLPSPETGGELDDLHRAFNELLGRLQEAFERQRRFAGDASHQLRTPLAAMLGQVEVALRRDRPTQEYREVLGRVHRQAGHLGRIVEALLFLTRADAEAALAEPGAVDLAAWLPGPLRRWADHERASDLQAECPPDGELMVQAQPVLLEQLFDNLLDNALKYSPSGTPVSVSLCREPGVVALAVQDAGPGIAPGDLPHIFEPFYRTAEARRLGHAGVGLGLAVARRIATAFGGTLTAESEPGHGSRFTLRLPAVTSLPESIQSPSLTEAVALSALASMQVSPRR